MQILISSAILDIRRHLESDKNFSSKIKNSNQKTERKNVQNSLSYGRKISFSPILKTCEIIFPISFYLE
jgi:hypothetical protein